MAMDKRKYRFYEKQKMAAERDGKQYEMPAGVAARMKEYEQRNPSEFKQKDTSAKPTMTIKSKFFDKARKALQPKSAEQKGEALAKKVIGPEGLERLGTDTEVQEVLARKKQISEEGISQAEQEALRTKMAQQMMQAEQTAGLRLGGALGGAQGAAAAAQQRSLMAQGMQARAGIERDIFLAQEQAKRTGLESYASSLGEVKTFDIGQAAKERDIMQSSIMGYEQMASAERAAKAQTEAAQAAVPKRKKFLGIF